MKTGKLFLAAFLFLSVNAIGQLKIGNSPNTINTNSVLELETTNMGLLLPRIALASTTSFSPLIAHVQGMTIYNISTAGDVTPGFYFDDGIKWIRVESSGKAWSLTGNAGTIDGTNFLGTTDNLPLSFRVYNQQAGRVDQILYNTFFGFRAGVFATNARNTAVGAFAFASAGAGTDNTALGYLALYSNNSANQNTAVGSQVLYTNTAGANNTGIGVSALRYNSNGNNNSALGYLALNQNTGAMQMLRSATAHSMLIRPAIW